MDLMQRRRIIIEAANQKAAINQSWDYTFLPDANTGLIDPVELKNLDGTSIRSGQKITIAWDGTGYDNRATLRILYSNGYTEVKESARPTIGQETFTADYNGMVYISRGRSAGTVTQTGYRFQGQYIKVRIES